MAQTNKVYVPHFKGLGMLNLEYEIRKYVPKNRNKFTIT